jgi:hypothetical protein
MNRNSLSILFAAAVAASLAAAACSKTDSAPTGFGVNVTVDATGVPMAMRAKITTDKLIVTSDKMGMAPVTRTLDDLPHAIQGGTVRFHYTPGAGITASNKLTFGLNVMDSAKNLIASGSSDEIQLATGAVDAKIVLSAGSGTDGGGTDGGGDDSGGGDGNPAGMPNGAACGTADDCRSGFCADGVCCNEKCDDVCVSCNQAASKGMCTPYAANSDPEMECVPVIMMEPDAGTVPEAGAAEAGGGDAGTNPDATGPATDGGDSDALVINAPDGGFMTMPKTCGGSCSGMRSCKFPDATVSCGKAFCNAKDQAAAFVCDGKGGCGPAVSKCSDYRCLDNSGACGTGCTSTADCLGTDYCDGQHCVKKKGNGIACVSPDECGSGNCIAGATGAVCCNTACDSPLTCTMAGAVGQCKCSECPNGTCQVFYPDADGDGFGDLRATYKAGTAKAACMGMPPVGFVADNTDCDDGDSNVKPTQTAYFPTKSRNGAGTFDYNCDGMLEKQTPEYPGGTCKFCGAVGACSNSSTSCTTANQASSWQCPQEYYNPIIRFDEPISTDGPLISPIPTPAGIDLTPRAVPIGPIIPIGFQCCGCLAGDRTGFLANIPCGGTSTTYTCGPCAAAGGGTTSSNTTGVVQNCH